LAVVIHNFSPRRRAEGLQVPPIVGLHEGWELVASRIKNFLDRPCNDVATRHRLASHAWPVDLLWRRGPWPTV